jgi:hypothetical protein
MGGTGELALLLRGALKSRGKVLGRHAGCCFVVVKWYFVKRGALLGLFGQKNFRGKL